MKKTSLTSTKVRKGLVIGLSLIFSPCNFSSALDPASTNSSSQEAFTPNEDSSSQESISDNKNASSQEKISIEKKLSAKKKDTLNTNSLSDANDSSSPSEEVSIKKKSSSKTAIEATLDNSSLSKEEQEDSNDNKALLKEIKKLNAKLSSKPKKIHSTYKTPPVNPMKEIIAQLEIKDPSSLSSFIQIANVKNLMGDKTYVKFSGKTAEFHVKEALTISEFKTICLAIALQAKVNTLSLIQLQLKKGIPASTLATVLRPSPLPEPQGTGQMVYFSTFALPDDMRILKEILDRSMIFRDATSIKVKGFDFRAPISEETISYLSKHKYTVKTFAEALSKDPDLASFSPLIIENPIEF